MKAFLNQKQVKNRKCGECTACCTRLKIEELDKDVNQDCRHLCKTGCSIYSDRPQTCSNFECVWLSGWLGGESHRPDKLGIMFCMWVHNDDPVLHAWELWPGAFDDDKAKRILMEVGQNSSFVAVRYDGKMMLIGRKGDNQQFRMKHLNRVAFSILPDQPLGKELVILNVTNERTYCDMPNMTRQPNESEKAFLVGLINEIVK